MISTPEVSQDLLDKYRDINVKMFSWWDCVYDDFRETMQGIGFDVADISFSGFWSQGDGAAFDSTLCNPTAFLLAYDLDQTMYPMIWQMLTLHGVLQIKTRSSGRRGLSLCIDIDCDWFENVLDYTNPLQAAAAQAMDRQLTIEMLDLEERVAPILRTAANTLYNNLEKEYVHFTSDELVREAIIANQLGDK